MLFSFAYIMRILPGREQEPLVALVYLVCLVYLVEPGEPDEPDKPQTKPADFFNSLLGSCG
jgi:hypothetical protein